MSTSENISLWASEIQKLAQSGRLAESINSVFGSSTNQHGLDALINALAKGDTSYLPHVEHLNAELMSNHPGAYAAATNTIYLNQNILDHASLVEEVLTHEFGHFLADHFFSGQEKPTDAYNFTLATLGKDNALVLSTPDAGAEVQTGNISLPGNDNAVDVAWFDTTLHIDWVKATLPMFNANALNLLTKAEKDSDAFDPIMNGGFGQQTQSATHFDNNNIRGSIEVARKRLENGVDWFNSQNISEQKNPDQPSPNDSKRELVTPGFTGADAGVQNLLYRFGQIEHAFSDFYSHSNWLELAANGGRMSETTILDSGLGRFTQLNPGDYISNAPKVMVAMAGPNYDATMQRAGTGSYSGSSQVVNWWVGLDSKNWGNAWANPKDGQQYSGGTVGGLMSGAVNGAIYSDTDYSVYLRAIDRGGWTQNEYFRGFSHGGLAGTIYGQWVSPLAKDSPNNGREYGDLLPYQYAVKNKYNAYMHNQAHVLADLQLRNDFDRMGNLIFEKYGAAGLRKFADFALVDNQRDLYVSTFSQPGARWNFDKPAAAVQAANAFMAAEPLVESSATSVAELPLRTVEVFHQDASSTLTTVANRSYLTQVQLDGHWVDSAAGLVGVHYETDTPGLYSAAQTQHAASGGRTLSSQLGAHDNSYLATTYSVENVNTQTRVYINNFDVGEDELQIVDAAGNVIELIDIDTGNFDQIYQKLLTQYNIEINARPETQTLTHAKVLHAAQANGPVLLRAADFFGDADVVHAANSNGATHSNLTFVNQDDTLPWLSLREDGLLEIADITKVAAGTYEVYVSVADGAGILEGVPIVIAIDPKVIIGSHAYAPTSSMDIHFRTAESGAISLFAQAYDQDGYSVSELQHLALRVGDNAGTPNGLDINHIRSELADQTNNGTMKFFAFFHDSNEMVGLDLAATSADNYSLKLQDQVIADFVMGQDNAVETYVDEIYVPGVNDLILGLKLDNLLPSGGSTTALRPHQVTLETTISRESALTGEFGLFLADLETGCVIDPTSGVQLEDLILDSGNIASYAVYSVTKSENGTSNSSASFLVDPQLNLHNVALLPYYKLANGQFLLADTNHTADGVSHIVRLGENSFGVEDLVGGDYDFDDMVIGINKISVLESVFA